METSQLRFLLQELHFSSALPNEVLDRLAEYCSVRQVAAGNYVFREGVKDSSLYLVRSGRLALEMSVPGRGAVRILTLGPGELAGWSSLLDDAKMTASALALEQSDLVVAPADQLQQVCDASHEFGFHLMRQLARALAKRLLATRLQLLDLFVDVPSGTVPGRSAQEGNPS